MIAAWFCWGLVLWLGGAAIGSEILTGSSNLTVALALAATGFTLLGLILDEPPRDRRPW